MKSGWIVSISRYCTAGLLVATLVCATQAADIVETAVKAKNFGTLVAALKATGLDKTLSGKGKFTVFAPTDEAFAKLPKGTVQTLLKPENKDRLAAILTYHVVPAQVTASAAIKVDSASTVLGQRLNVSSELGRLSINDAKVVATDIQCDNGIIHVIDSVLLPEEKTIPEVAKAAKSFQTLLAAVTEAGLAETLGGEGPFTVFAPTDEAFAKLPQGTVEDLLKPENRKQLTKILTYHVVAGRVFSDQVVDAKEAKTLSGQSVNISLAATGIKINDAVLRAADIQAANGVIHIIDAVLLPESLNAEATSDLLINSVRTGASAFNSGDYHRCFEVYQNACKRIVSEGEELPEEVPVVLEIALKRAKEKKSEQEKAWVLRHGIDLAFYALEH